MQSDRCLEEMQDACRRLIRTARVITLSTGNDAGIWAAPLYYIYRDTGFYFFSDHRARHITEGVGRPAAASIFKDSPDFSQLRGIQMSGGIEACIKGKESAAAAVDYVGKYGIRVSPKSNFLTFFKTRFNAGLYRFTPEETYYMDNRKKIGNRIKLKI